MFWRWTIAIALLTIPATRAQLNTDGSGAFTRFMLCNETFDAANATGIFARNPNVDQGYQSGQPENTSRKTLPVNFAFTLTQYDNRSRLDASYWFNPRGADYADNFQLDYDVCASALQTVTDEVRYRGQSENGSCYDTFDEQCIDAIKSAAEQYALSLTQYPTPPPTSNLTWNSIGPVCDKIRDLLQDNFPQPCAKFFNGSAIAYLSTPLTGYNSSTIYSSSCSTNASYNDSYHRIFNQFVDYSDQAYATLARALIPVVTVWMPIANAERPSSIDYAHAELVCSHITQYTSGSEVPAPLTKPSDRSDASVSQGAIAGIVIAVVVGVGVIGALTAWCVVMKRRREPATASPEPRPTEKFPQYDNPPQPMTEGIILEMPVDGRQHELDGGMHIHNKGTKTQIGGRSMSIASEFLTHEEAKTKTGITLPLLRVRFLTARPVYICRSRPHPANCSSTPYPIISSADDPAVASNDSPPVPQGSGPSPLLTYSLKAISFIRATIGGVSLIFPDTLGTQRPISRSDAVVFRMLGLRELFLSEHLRTTIKETAENGGDTRDLRKAVDAMVYTGIADVGMYLFILTHAAKTWTGLGIDHRRVSAGVTMMAIGGAVTCVVGFAAVKFGGLRNTAQGTGSGRR
ncbi:unnamed protein product [Zymoseptoria tritici ST99CH_3D7]|uniref:Uncharacterized protein n=1 Tax=Zymoseptoria tritici (strain ST99CH_3D7) TaxID=1276538 RepID=A0A1X7RI09_ZYMT9|nr:unnamed protein product [Zymoseptoria tritici ST99CH_3D7]